MSMRAVTTLIATLLIAFLASGCAPASVDGEVSGQQVGKIKTAFFDTVSEEGFSYMMIYLSDYKATCEEMKAAVDNEETMWPDDSDQVVGVFFMMLTVWNEADFSFDLPSETGEYKIFNLYDYTDYVNLSDGDMLSWSSIAMANESDTVDVSDISAFGSVVLDKIDLEGKVKGSFDVTMDGTSASLVGDFTVEACDIY